MGTTENSLPSRIYEENHGNHRFDHNHCAGIGTLICQSMSIKNLYAYTHTGFGCIIRHFQAKGISCVTPEVLDTFLLEQHELFEQGAFSPWKWRLVRGSCELLKHCAEEDSVDMPPLLPWSPNLQRPRQSIEKSKPTAEQLADPENIFVLVWKTNRAMMELGLPDATVRHYREEGLAAILGEREILILRIEKQYTYAEISKILDLAEISCRSRFFRAKEHLKILLEEKIV